MSRKKAKEYLAKAQSLGIPFFNCRTADIGQSLGTGYQKLASLSLLAWATSSTTKLSAANHALEWIRFNRAIPLPVSGTRTNTESRSSPPSRGSIEQTRRGLSAYPASSSWSDKKGQHLHILDSSLCKLLGSTGQRGRLLLPTGSTRVLAHVHLPTFDPRQPPR